MKFFLNALLFLTSFSGFASSPRPSLQNYSYPFMQLEEEKTRFWDRVSIGGNIGLQFGNTTYILLSPSLGYTPKTEFLNNRLMFGLGVTYIYSRTKYADVKYTSNIYGGRLFTRFLVTDNIFAYTEYESLNAPNYLTYKNERAWVNSFFVGGGYLQRFSDKGGVTITALYNLAWTTNNLIYSSPWNIRIGFIL